jgi:hypothetical protein
MRGLSGGTLSELRGADRRLLRGLGNPLRPVVIVGKQGASAAPRRARHPALRALVIPWLAADGTAPDVERERDASARFADAIAGKWS